MMRIIINESQARAIRENTMKEIDALSRDINDKPTEAQKKAGNYKMAHITFNGFKITIENRKGSRRYWTDENGNKGYNLMHNHYGYFSNTLGKDGDHIDVFLGPNINSDKIFPIDQNKKDGSFDETKVMLGFDTAKEAKKAYMSNYSKNWKGFRAITEVDKEFFKKWLYDGMKQQKPFSEYYSVKKINEDKDFMSKHGIEEVDPGVGFSEKENKWYGWSHRAIYGFTIGSKVKKGHAGYKGKEWTAKNMKDAEQMARDFADGVS